MPDITTITALRVVGGIVLLLANGFFVGIEFGLTRVRQFSETDFQGRGLSTAWTMTDQLEIYLSGCQVGITICSVGLGVVAEPALAAILDPALVAAGLATPAAVGHTAVSVGVALGAINLAHVIVGEQVPTYLGVERTKTVTKYGAPVLYWWTMVMYPVIKLADWTAKTILGVVGVTITRSWAEEDPEEDAPTSRAEVRRRIGEALHGNLPPERREEVINALDIGDTPVSEIMVPADEVVALSAAAPVAENLQRMRSHPLSRYPLVGETMSEFYGVVYAPDVLRRFDALRDGDTTIRDLARTPLTIRADTPVSEAIDRFQAADSELALVTDQTDGSVVGLVTVTDAWEAITGDLEDPLDAEVPAA